jgi:saccharopine dehydrogenase-like NADP-dependent oxidoreductase
MNNLIVIGAGMVGSAIAIDMAKKHTVTLTDISKESLERIRVKHPNIEVRQLDVTDERSLTEAVRPFDLVICAVPGFLGFATLKKIIEAEKNVVDISFFSENALELDALAREKNVTAIVDCGVAPGMDNILLGYHNEKMKIDTFECLVGGLPKVKKWPFFYKAPFSPIDVIEEYTRPARYVENGFEVVREPLTDCEYVDFEKVGTLESFNTDGLRSIIQTMPHIPNMKEKTLRYPGHVEYIMALKQSGFFSKEEIEIDGTRLRPLDFTSKVLIDEWKLEDQEEELTVMRITIRGENERGEQEEIIYDLHDEYCHETNTTSMSRTTGYTATAVANMLLEGLFEDKGVFPPELVGKKEACFQYIIDYLEERNIVYKKQIRPL